MIEINLDELPPSLLAQLSIHERPRLDEGQLTEEILFLLTTHGQLSVDELLVGLYQNTGAILPRHCAYSNFTRMRRHGYIEQVTPGVYSPTGKKRPRKGRQTTPALGQKGIPAGFRDPFPRPRGH